MTTAARVTAPAQEQQGPSLYRFSVDQYLRMVATGVLTEEDKVELLEGRIVNKMPPNPPHGSSITRLSRRLNRSLPDEWVVRIQLPIATSDSAPEPDIAVVRGPEEAYDARHATADDIALLIEVADSTLHTARTEKLVVYARARITVYWIANIPERQIEVYTQPRAGKSPTYRQQQIYRNGESVPLVIAGQMIAQLAVHDLLPAPA